MYYDNEAAVRSSADGGLPFNPFKALVAPRPIGWVSTLDQDGVVNLAPYSYFQAVADRPDVVMFSATPAIGEDGRFMDARKDSETLAEQGGEFVCNLVTMALAEAMNVTSASLPRGESEAEAAGLALVPSNKVKPPRVAAAPAALECVVVDAHPVMHRGGRHRYHMIFGEVVGMHIDDRFVSDGRVDTVAMEIVTRMGYDEYAVLETKFAMSRPDLDPMKSGLLK